MHVLHMRMQAHACLRHGYIPPAVTGVRMPTRMSAGCAQKYIHVRACLAGSDKRRSAQHESKQPLARRLDRHTCGAGAVVTKDVEPYEIVAGNPARKIGSRSLENGLVFSYDLNYKPWMG